MTRAATTVMSNEDVRDEMMAYVRDLSGSQV